MIILDKKDINLLMTLSKEIFHATKTIDSLESIGLIIEGVSDEDTIGNHLYSIISTAHNEFYNTLEINKDDLSIDQRDTLDNTFMDMDSAIIAAGIDNEENLINVLKKAFNVISKIINVDIVMTPNENTM